MNRNQRRFATKKAVAAGAATNFADLRRNAERVNGELADAVFDGWRFAFSTHPALGKHLSASKVSPAASEETLLGAKSALGMPDKAEDCSFHMSENGVMHWHWASTLEDSPPAGYEMEIHGDLDAFGREWLVIALAAASQATQTADKLGVSTSGAHFSVTNSSGANVCIHMTRKGEPKAAGHTVH